jgi:hypothetical protein
MSQFALNAQSVLLMKRIEVTNLAIACVVALAVLVGSGFGGFFYGVLTGGVIGAANWRAIVWLAGKISNAGKKSVKVYAALAGAKMTILCSVIWAAASLLPVTPLGLLLGLSSLVAAIFASTLFGQLQPADCEGSIG